ncbi:MAG: phosphoribosylformimino-5-aminoimidazole carboxamide ribotide isomerase [bacterium]|nr:phosphoribosylformimino-5-aminoimidazole carboxamide ribotide isomerase [bacterium]MCM1375028.1 phosphoribosylformimino-5-aminoimidazole carboxamide ribotide isomerase [Muribaculum sp.]
MEFRPCIDIHNGKVKQIVGGSLQDQGDMAQENYVSGQDAAFYAEMYRQAGIRGGHIILLNGADSVYYEETRRQALAALRAYPGGLQVGGGIHTGNAREYLDAGASHVIVTSYVFHDGRVDYERLKELELSIGRDRLVLDLSCRRIDGEYRIVTDRWQKATQEALTEMLLNRLSVSCSEFLIHAVDVEGKAAGIERELAAMLGAWGGLPITYAGGVHSYEELRLLKQLGQDRLNVTIGSALELFGGKMQWEKVLEICKEKS